MIIIKPDIKIFFSLKQDNSPVIPSDMQEMKKHHNFSFSSFSLYLSTSYDKNSLVRVDAIEYQRKRKMQSHKKAAPAASTCCKPKENCSKPIKDVMPSHLKTTTNAGWWKTNWNIIVHLLFEFNESIFDARIGSFILKDRILCLTSTSMQSRFHYGLSTLHGF